MKLHDAGVRHGDMYDRPAEVEEVKNRIAYPEMRINDKQFPEIDKLSVGKKTMLLVEVKPRSFSVGEMGRKLKNMDLEILRIGIAKNQKEEIESEEKTNKIIEKMYKGDKKEDKKEEE